MVLEKIVDGKKLFLCSECGLAYLEKKWAHKCEKWCKQYHSCNLLIIKHAVKDG